MRLDIFHVKPITVSLVDVFRFHSLLSQPHYSRRKLLWLFTTITNEDNRFYVTTTKLVNADDIHHVKLILIAVPFPRVCHLQYVPILCELVAQSVEGSALYPRRAERHKFEPQSTSQFLSVPFNLYFMTSLSFCWSSPQITVHRRR